MSAIESSVVFVTGASEGIGKIVAAHLADEGYRVAVGARSLDTLHAVAQEIGALAVPLDVTDVVSVNAAIERIEDELGPVELLVNNAGTAGTGKVTWLDTPDEWWRVMEVNVKGTFLCAQRVLPAMLSRGSGRIVNVSSAAANFPIESADDFLDTSYMASKAAVNRFSEALAVEARAQGVSVFAVSPGKVKTAMTRAPTAPYWNDEDFWSPPELAAHLVAYIATGALDAYSGRYIHAARDDWRNWS